MARSDAELVDAAIAGDRAGFAELVRRYQRAVFATAWKTLQDFHAAQDAAQDAYVLAHRKLTSLNDPSCFGTWLLTITRREAIRTAKRRVGEPQELAGDIVIPDQHDWPSEDLADLLAAVGELPEQERVVVVLRYLDGHSVKSICEITGRPFGTVTKQLSRAVRRLKKTLWEAINEQR